MIKTLFSIMLSVSILVLPALIFQPISAQSDFTSRPCGSTGASICEVGDEDPISGEDGLIMRVVGIVSYVVGFASVVMIIIAGLKFVTSNGSAENVSSARNTVIFALVGLAVAASSQFLVRFILNTIGSA